MEIAVVFPENISIQFVELSALSTIFWFASCRDRLLLHPCYCKNNLDNFVAQTFLCTIDLIVV